MATTNLLVTQLITRLVIVSNKHKTTEKTNNSLHLVVQT